MTWPEYPSVRRARTVVDGLPWLMASDGHAAVIEQREPRDGEEFSDSIEFEALLVRPALAAIANSLDARLEALRVPPDPEPPPCTKCNGTLKVKCSDCKGTSQVECECSDCGHQHEADCAVCDNGITDCDCVDAPPSPRYLSARIGGIDGVYDRRLITIVLDEMPHGDSTRIGKVKVNGWSALLIARGGAYGIVIPMTDSPKDAPLYIVTESEP